ncbi:MAG: hypothetical protein EOS81_04105 [Mesorhizobium sp.]|nr:MAG: hypothetical protein EOS81_04105 [Mesorhizobium sp.]
MRVAGSLPPLFESYRPGNFKPDEAPHILESLVVGLAPHIDLWLIETQSSTAEALTALAAVGKSHLPAFVYPIRLRTRTGELVRPNCGPASPSPMR